MKKYLITALITSILMVAALGATVFLLAKNQDKFKDEIVGNQEELGLLSDQKADFDKDKAILLTAKGEDPNIVTYGQRKSGKIYNTAYSESIRNDLNKKIKRGDYGFDGPLWAENPFGTNNLSLYLYFKTGEDTRLKYTISVEDETIPDFTRVANNSEYGDLSAIHEYQLNGLVPGMKNYIILQLYNQKDKLVNQAVYVYEPEQVEAVIPVKLSVTEGRSEEKDQISNGLFCILGYDIRNEKTTPDILMYDNAGILRGDIPLEGYRSDRVEFVDNNMVYSYDEDQFAVVSNLGQVLKTYSIKGYTQHHDFIYNGYGQLWILATQNSKKTVEDVIISLDLKTGKVKKLLDMGTLMPDIRKKAKKVKGAKKTDWLHINSIAMSGSSDLILSCRELSAIIKVENVTSQIPKIKYIIGDPSIWKKTKYSDLVLQKVAKENPDATPTPTPLIDSILDEEGDKEPFLSHFGQHTVAYEEGVNLGEGQYYLYMFNNNYGRSFSRPDIKWNQFKGIGLDKKDAANSMYYRYLVDETAGTVTLIESIKVPYSNIVSSAQNVGSHRVVNSGVACIFAEYDRMGNLIYDYTYPADSYTYRIFKYDMKGFWYQ